MVALIDFISMHRSARSAQLAFEVRSAANAAHSPIVAVTMSAIAPAIEWVSTGQIRLCDERLPGSRIRGELIDRPKNELRPRFDFATLRWARFHRYGRPIRRRASS